MAKVRQLLHKARTVFAKARTDPNFAVELQSLKALVSLYITPRDGGMVNYTHVYK